MAEKSVDVQLAEIQKQIDELLAKKHALEHPIVEYPKYVGDVVVKNADEEMTAKAPVKKDAVTEKGKK